jgi:hypothetical protein
MSNALVVIPTYNEIENIEPLLRDIILLQRDFDILVVDDNSPDGTSAQVEQLIKEYPDNIFLLKRTFTDLFLFFQSSWFSFTNCILFTVKLIWPNSIFAKLKKKDRMNIFFINYYFSGLFFNSEPLFISLKEVLLVPSYISNLTYLQSKGPFIK